MAAHRTRLLLSGTVRVERGSPDTAVGTGYRYAGDGSRCPMARLSPRDATFYFLDEAGSTTHLGALLIVTRTARHG